MDQFPSARNLSSWAGVCPGNNESAGKKRSGKTRRGGVWLRRVLCEAAWAAFTARNRTSTLTVNASLASAARNAPFIAVAHSILGVAYVMLKEHRVYQDLGADYFERANRRMSPSTTKRSCRS